MGGVIPVHADGNSTGRRARPHMTYRFAQSRHGHLQNHSTTYDYHTQHELPFKRVLGQPHIHVVKLKIRSLMKPCRYSPSRPCDALQRKPSRRVHRPSKPCRLGPPEKKQRFIYPLCNLKSMKPEIRSWYCPIRPAIRSFLKEPPTGPSGGASGGLGLRAGGRRPRSGLRGSDSLCYQGHGVNLSVDFSFDIQGGLQTAVESSKAKQELTNSQRELADLTAPALCTRRRMLHRLLPFLSQLQDPKLLPWPVLLGKCCVKASKGPQVFAS